MKKKFILISMWVFFFGSMANTFAWGWWWFSWWFGSNNHRAVSIDNFEKVISQEKEDILQKKKKLEEKVRRVKNTKKRQILQKQAKIVEKVEKNEKIKKEVEKVEKMAKVAKLIENIIDAPVNKKKWTENTKKIVKKIVENKLQNLTNQTAEQLDTKIINKLWGDNAVKEFKLTDKFDPNKVVTFDDLKALYISNFTLYQNLLGCDDPDDAVVKLCENVANLLDELTDKNKKLTINDVYKLQVYANTISQAIFYVWTLKEFKKWAVVLWINKTKNLLKSMDIVRNYTTYDTANNDVLPVKAKEVDIDVLTSKPQANGDDVKIVLGLDNGSVRWLRLYPIDKDLYIPYAKTYKVMTIKGLTKWCADNEYEYSIWYGYNKIWLSWSWDDLQPSGTEGIKFNFDEKCYDIFNW